MYKKFYNKIMKTRNAKIGDKIIILYKGFDAESKWKKEGIVTGINKNLHILWGTWEMLLCLCSMILL